MKIYSTLISISLSLSSFHLISAESAKNIIYMIGDGMGPSYISAYKYYKNDKQAKLLDNFELGSATTYPADKTWVTDSAASATALSTGVKSYNGAIAVDKNLQPLTTLFEHAKQQKMHTGIAVTSQVTHATPASFYAHQSHRKQYHQIANWLVPPKGKAAPVDIIIGGGVNDLIRTDRNIINELQTMGYQHISDFEQLDSITLPSVAVFHDIAFPSAIDSDTQRLSTMTTAALQGLSTKNPNGFVLLVEGSQIDWCGHYNEIACAMAELEDFYRAIEVAKQYVDNNPDTLLVITADHETGGLSLGRNGDYDWQTEKVKLIKTSATKLAERINASTAQSISTIWSEYVGFELTQEQLSQLTQLKEAGVFEDTKREINHIFNTATKTGWTSSGHTAADVNVYAYGKGSKSFVGTQDNTDIAKKLITIIKN